MASGTTLNQYEGAGTKTVSMFSKLVSQGSNFVMEGVKNLVVKRHVSYCTVIIFKLYVLCSHKNLLTKYLNIIISCRTCQLRKLWIT